MIYELLQTGKENAIPGKKIAEHLGVNIRNITRIIELERRQGHPICATAEENIKGYFLPADDTELAEYCESLKGRAIELFKTRQALVKVLKQIRDNSME